MGEQPTSGEQGVARKHGLIVAILHEPANAILSMAWSMQRLNSNTADIEGLSIRRSFGYCYTVNAANNRLA
jgi:hypothetical protein